MRLCRRKQINHNTFPQRKLCSLIPMACPPPGAGSSPPPPSYQPVSASCWQRRGWSDPLRCLAPGVFVLPTLPLGSGSCGPAGSGGTRRWVSSLALCSAMGWGWGLPSYALPPLGRRGRHHWGLDPAAAGWGATCDILRGSVSSGRRLGNRGWSAWPGCGGVRRTNPESGATGGGWRGWAALRPALWYPILFAVGVEPAKVWGAKAVRW